MRKLISEQNAINETELCSILFIYCFYYKKTNNRLIYFSIFSSDEEHTFGVLNENGIYVFEYTIEARTWLALSYTV